MVAFQQLVPPPEVATSLVALTERHGHGIAAVYRVLGLAWDPRLIAPVPPPSFFPIGPNGGDIERLRTCRLDDDERLAAADRVAKLIPWNIHQKPGVA